MTNSELLDLLYFVNDIENVEIVNQAGLKHSATFVVAKLTFADGSDVMESKMTIPFVYYDGHDWIFLPNDWQGWLPDTPDDIDRITWVVGGTETEGVIFDGLPMLAPWIDEFKDTNRETRQRIGAHIRSARVAKGLSIRALADKTGIDKGIICRIESGRINSTIDTLNTIAKQLDLELVLNTY